MSFLSFGGGPHLSRGRGVHDPRYLFSNGEKGGIWLPENSDVAVASAVGQITDISPNAKHFTQGTAANKATRRTNATTGYDYLEPAGGNDFYQTSAIDFSGTDAVTVFLAVRKLTDAAQAIIMELSATTVSNAGTFNVLGPAGAGQNNYTFRSRGSINTASVADTGASYASPHSAVIVCEGDISSDTMTIEVNGVAGTPVALDQGTGNYGNFALNLLARNGTGNFFSGHFYGAIVLGRAATAAEKTSVKNNFAARMGVALP